MRQKTESISVVKFLSLPCLQRQKMGVIMTDCFFFKKTHSLTSHIYRHKTPFFFCVGRESETEGERERAL